MGRGFDAQLNTVSAFFRLFRYHDSMGNLDNKGIWSVLRRIKTGVLGLNTLPSRLRARVSLPKGRLIQALFALFVVVALSVPLVALLPKTCSQPGLDFDVSTRPQPISTVLLDENNLKQDGGFYTYEQDNNMKTRIGIDVSSHQGVIDWQAVAKNGIEFAFIRVGVRGYTVGDISLDNQYQANIEGAVDAGIKVGVYFFSQAIDEIEALAEADFVLQQLSGRALDYPVVYDLESVAEAEGRINALSSEQRVRNARAFCERIEAAGYTAMLYGNVADIAHYYQDPTLADDYGIWFAQYDVSEPVAPLDFTIWQFTSSGVINGIGTRVDLNIHFSPEEGPRLPDSIIIHHEEPQ
jgi:GH25 family lysozyme M1 (1,4-beta-N-acetylmuramidase)